MGVSFKNNKFVFDHIGDVYETGLIIFGSRALIEMLESLREKAGNEKWSPRVKMWTSVLLGMAVPMVIESLGLGVGGNTVGPDYWDAIIGPGISGALVGGSWEFENFIADSETHIRAKMMKDRFDSWMLNVGTSVEDAADLMSKGDLLAQRRIAKAFDKIMMSTGDFIRTANKNVEEFDVDRFIKIPSQEELVDRTILAFERIFNRSENK